MTPTQVANGSELVGELEELSSLETEYAHDDAIYQAKIQVLENECTVPHRYPIIAVGCVLYVIKLTTINMFFPLIGFEEQVLQVTTDTR